MNYFIHMLLYLLRCEEYFSVIICTFYIIDCVQGLEFFHCNFYIIGLEKNHFGPKSILLCTNRKWGFLQCSIANRDTSKAWKCDKSTKMCPVRCWRKCPKTGEHQGVRNLKVKQAKHHDEKVQQKSIFLNLSFNYGISIKYLTVRTYMWTAYFIVHPFYKRKPLRRDKVNWTASASKKKQITS